MWKDYSFSYIKNNRSSSVSVLIAAFLAALFLSLLCGSFYNLWKYEVERIEIEEGNWQSRIEGTFDRDDVEALKGFATLKDVTVEDGSIWLRFERMWDVLGDTPKIARLLGVSEEKISYHYGLLAMYLIRDGRDTAQRMVFPVVLLVTVLAAVSLIVMLHYPFAVSMNARVHQFGIFSSIGATPKQIRACLMQEAAILCTPPILAGTLLGILGSRGLVCLSNQLGSGVPGRHEAVFGYHPLILALTLLAIVLTVGISAWMPARTVSRLTPLEAIRDMGELKLKRRKHSPILRKLFGVEGELAGNAWKAQKKALRLASFSLTISLMAFILMLCFFTMSEISTRETYFERYQDIWDLYVTVKDTEVDSVEQLSEIRSLSGVERVIGYQKAAAKSMIGEEDLSEELKALGGLEGAEESSVQRTEDGYLINAPILILDDASFLAYCEEQGIPETLDGAVIFNRIRDVTNPDFRHPRYLPYTKGENETALLKSADGEKTVQLSVLAYAETLPALREEYGNIDYYEMVHIVPASLWREIKGEIGGAEKDSYLCVLGEGTATLEGLQELGTEVGNILETRYTVESENRIQEQLDNDRQIQGMKLIFGGICVLLAVIGIGNVFSNTLGFVRQRKREIARYLSVGMTPGEIRKMFAIEALIIAGRPILLSAVLTALAVWGMLRMSYLEAAVFFAEAPVLPAALFVLAILAFVALAYGLGWRSVQRFNLAEVLRDDTVM
ncbi:MAG TPA: ABC transporter permease [Candidatus Limivivens merdigallinarum]|uniref:ABC transporter permease n=1 Tax=Candidatus Limivivens merdigallinarum TaxID=2840859 RepID=A0A9D0ZVP1_9FIRM|nr:ABC transporter permease [Candidatus Limivivens merdigallinarum]